MSDLSFIEKRKLEKALDMGSGYVLNFSNKTFEEFIFDSVGIEIYSPKYNRESGSKANRMRAFWEKESNYLVGKLLGDIFENWEELASSRYNLDTGEHEKYPIPEECLRIVERLKTDSIVSEIDAVDVSIQNKGFKVLAQSVKEYIKRNEPDVGLDRLHTFLMKYFRVLCEKHGIVQDRRKPLHSMVGEYVKKLKDEGIIESEMTERILKSSISIMEAFNRVRNEQSLAHDNKILNYNEALLIFNHVTSSIKFIESIEVYSIQENEKEDDTSEDDTSMDEIPF